MNTFLIIAWAGLCLSGIAGGLLAVTHYARRSWQNWLARHTPPPPAPPGPRVRHWLRDKRCGCAWTIDRPVLVRPCAWHAHMRVTIRDLKTWEIEMPDLVTKVRRRLPPRKVHR